MKQKQRDGPADADRSLLAAAKHGDHDAFGALYEQHVRDVYRYALRMLRDTTGAEDITQDVFTLAWANRAEITIVDRSLLPWLLVTTRNLSLNRLKRTNRQASSLESTDVVDSRPGPEDALLDRQLAKAIQDAVARLSDSASGCIGSASSTRCLIETLPLNSARRPAPFAIGSRGCAEPFNFLLLRTKKDCYDHHTRAHRRADPHDAPEHHDPDQRRRSGHREAGHGEASRFEADRSPPNRLRGRRVAAAAALIVGTILIPGSDSSAEAAGILNRAAELSVTASSAVAEPGQYLKIETLEAYSIVGDNSDGEKVSWVAPQTTVVYKPGDPDAEWVLERHQLMPTEFFGPGAREAAMKEWDFSRSDPNRNGIFRAKNAAFYGTPDPARSTDGLPRDPQELYDYIRAQYNGGSNSLEEDMWVRITALLRTGTAPADLRSALYGAAALIPGIEVVPGQATLNGRTGIAIGRVEESRKQRQDIIIDEKTGELIGERSVLTEDAFGAPAGTPRAATSVTTTVVDSAP